LEEGWDRVEVRRLVGAVPELVESVLVAVASVLEGDRRAVVQ
jgi:hypothetical protein